jgi:hypothetical protein
VKLNKCGKRREKCAKACESSQKYAKALNDDFFHFFENFETTFCRFFWLSDNLLNQKALVFVLFSMQFKFHFAQYKSLITGTCA